MNFPNFTYAAPESALSEHELKALNADSDSEGDMDEPTGLPPGTITRVEPSALGQPTVKRTYIAPITQKDLASSPSDQSAPIRAALGP